MHSRFTLFVLVMFVLALGACKKDPPPAPPPPPAPQPCCSVQCYEDVRTCKSTIETTLNNIEKMASLVKARCTEACPGRTCELLKEAEGIRRQTRTLGLQACDCKADTARCEALRKQALDVQDEMSRLVKACAEANCGRP